MKQRKVEYCIYNEAGGRVFYFEQQSADFGLMFTTNKGNARRYTNKKEAESNLEWLRQKCKREKLGIERF